MSDVEKLKAKLREWQDCLDGKYRLSIWKQITSIVWWSAFFRCINESRKFLPDGPEGEKLANGNLHELINEGYTTLHVATMRRVLDSRKDTNSLVNLIRDIKRHSTLLTRRNMLDARGLAYDFGPAKDQALREASHQADAREGAHFISGEGWALAESWHDQCDELCGTNSRTRNPMDQPNPQKFQQLLDDLGREGRDVEEYANNYVAHAAPSERQAMLPPEYRSLSLEKMWKAERAILRVAGFITRCVVDGADRGGVPIPQFLQFENLDRPFASPEAIAEMYRVWERHRHEIEGCRGWTWGQPLNGPQDEARS